ncbi:MAG: hypothetical protein K0R24_1725 [Gammaproteobacteria bacterium]|nr:hypothetical protein [Gammaproteobacteria bacterium]
MHRFTSGVDNPDEEMARRPPYKNRNGLILPVAVHAYLTSGVVNHSEVNEWNPDPSLFLFDALGNVFDVQHVYGVLSGCFDKGDWLFDGCGHVFAVNRCIHNRYSLCRSDCKQPFGTDNERNDRGEQSSSTPCADECWTLDK